MVCLTVLYPNNEGAKFDFEYYLGTHLELAERLLKHHGLQRIQISRGVGQFGGGSPQYLCIALLYFSSMEALQQALDAHAESLKADVPHYTDIEPEIQISEVLV